jgi:uncharacterized protein YkwD
MHRLVLHNPARLLCAAVLVAITVAAGAAPPPTAPSPAQGSVQAASQKLAAGDFCAAIGLLKTACTQQPAWIVPHQYLAVAYQASGADEPAREEYRLLQRLTADWTLAGRTNEPAIRDEVLQAEAEGEWNINHVRQQAKLPLLRPDPLLTVCAREHSLEMRDVNYCEHFSPTPGCRAAFDRFRLLFGYLPVFIAENIARIEQGRGEQSLIDRVTATRAKFMASPGHRRNTLVDGVSSVGVGLAITDDGIFWITEEFAQLSDESAGPIGRPVAPGSLTVPDSLAAGTSED